MTRISALGTCGKWLHFGFGWFATLLLSACVANVQYDAAIPVIPEQVRGELHNELVELRFPQLTLYAQLQAFDWDGQYLLPPLGLWLNIDPKGKPLTITTSKVTLLSDGEPAPSVAFLGPDVAWFSPRALAAGCGPRFYRTGIGLTRFGASQESVLNADNTLGIFRPSEEPIRFAETSCFLFWFDTDSFPTHDFLLSIKGVSIEGKEIEIPDIRFKKGSLSQLRVFP